MSKTIYLKDEKILDSWSTMIEQGQDKKGEIYKRVPEFIQEANAPGVKYETVKVKPGSLRGIFVKDREYLRVTNESLKDYKIYVGAREYGNNLDVSWYLTCEPGVFKSTLSGLLTKGASDKAVSFMLDIFQQQDLNAYATVVHHCILKSVEDIMNGLNQDPSKIERKSKGFLGIS